MESLIEWFRATLLPYGSPGLLALAFLDSSFVPMPQVFDLVVMLSCALRPDRAWLYALAVTVGSTLGTLVVFALARVGRARLGRRSDSELLATAEGTLRRYGAVAVAVAAVLPAPFPFKYVVVAAGLLRQPTAPFAQGVVAGRAVRFGSQAFIAVAYGDIIIDAFRDYAPALGIGLAVLLVVLWGIFTLLRRRLAASRGIAPSA